MSQTYENPYHSYPEEQTKRLQSRIPTEVHQFFWTIRGSNGTFTTTVNILIEKLRLELERRGITDIVETASFESFVSNCKLVLPTEIDLQSYGKSLKPGGTPTTSLKPGCNLYDSTSGGVDTKAKTSDVKRRVARASGKAASTKD